MRKTFILELMLFALASTVLGQPQISGPLSGNLGPGVYIITDHITIASTDSLIIQPGTVFLFNGCHDFSVNGYIYAVGTEDDSIDFIPLSADSNWQGIVFNSAVDTCRLAYCNITGSNECGIEISYSSPRIEFCRIFNNTAEAGGGIKTYDTSTPYIINCIIESNSANFGGGIACFNSHPIISSNTISNNNCVYGGGIYCYNSSSPVIDYNIILDNLSSVNGGGIFCQTNSHPTIVNNIIKTNTAFTGGGIFCGSQPDSFAYNEISNNTAYNAGGIYLTDISPLLMNNTIVFNTASANVGGLYSDDASPEVKNCILWGNTPEQILPVAVSNVQVTYSDIQQFWVGTGNIDFYPAFVDTVNDDLHLLSGSPCIDTGDPASPRDPDGTNADMGAYFYEREDEWSLVLTVTGETGSAPNLFTLTIGGGDSLYLPAPPAPPQYLTWTELYTEQWGGPYSQLIQEFAPGDTLRWLLLVDPNGNVAPPVSRTSVVSWVVAELPSAGAIYIQGFNTGAVVVADMRAQSSFSMTGTQIMYYTLVWIVAGTTTEPHLVINPTSYNFGGIAPGLNSDTTTIRIINDGEASGTGIISLDNSADFRANLAMPYSFVLAAGETLEVEVWFESELPLGLKTGNLLVDAAAPGNDVSCALSGTTIEGGGVSPWDAVLTVTGEAGTAPNLFTVTIGGGDSLYLPAPPPPPQYLTWTELYTEQWVGPYSQLIQEFDPGDTLRWLLLVDPNGNVAPPVSRTSVVSWVVAELPSAGLIYIEDFNTGAVVAADMRAQNSFSVTGTQIMYYTMVWVIPVGGLNPPENVLISIIDSSVHITWDAVPGATEYIVYISSDPYDFSSAVQIPVMGTEYIDTMAGIEVKFYRITTTN